MRVLAICQDELVIRSLDEVLLPSFEVDFLVESRPLARRLHDAGIEVTAGDPRRVDTYLKADITPTTCFLIEDSGKRSIKKILDAIRDAGGTLIYVLHTGKPGANVKMDGDGDITHLSVAELLRPVGVWPLLGKLLKQPFADAEPQRGLIPCLARAIPRRATELGKPARTANAGLEGDLKPPHQLAPLCGLHLFGGAPPPACVYRASDLRRRV